MEVNTLKAKQNGKLPDRYCYPAVITYNDGIIEIRFCDLDCKIKEVTEKDALKNARIALGRHLFALEQNGESLPVPTAMTTVELGPNQCTTLVDVYMPSIRLAEINRSVNRMISLPAWLNAAALERNVNFSQILQEALKEEIFHDFID